MSANGGRRAGSARRCKLFCAAFLLVSAALAQEPPPEDPGAAFPLGARARTALTRVQMDWLDWLVACNEGDAQSAGGAVESLLSHTRLVGMERVPALGTAAAVRAVEFAEAGDRERARLGLEAAAALDPGRPEIAFAAARVAAAEDDYLGSIRSVGRAYLLAFLAPEVRFVLLNNLALWVVTVLILTGLLLVGVLMVARGPSLYFDLFRFFNRFAPALLGHLLCLVLLSWPFLLPAGALWTAFYWSVLLWAYGGRLERVLLIALWVFIGSLPAALSEQGRRVELALFAPVQSIAAAARGDLEGDLFRHLGVLSAIVPESVALRHFSADLHRKLGQLESARSVYLEVLAAEPGNQSALNDLGTYYFEVSDFHRALDHFEQAAESGPGAGEVFFNLSQTHSELYAFTDSEQALLQARALDSSSVNRWLRRGLVERVVPMGGGLDRVGEIRSELRAQWRVGEEMPGWLGQWVHTLSLPLIIVFVLVAVAVRLATRRGRAAKKLHKWWGPGLDRLRRVLLAGVPEAEEGHMGRAALSLLVLVALASLPLLGRLGYSPPWAHTPPGGLLTGLSAVGLVVYLSVRFWRHGRGHE